MNTEHIKQKLAELKQDYKKTAEGMFHDGVKELFEIHSLLDSFGFTAYSPYFNDGDECRFSAHTDYPYINGYNQDEEEDERDEHVMSNHFPAREGDSFIWDKVGKWKYSNDYKNKTWIDGDKEIDAMVKDVREFLGSFDNDVWEELIGNHVIVRITKDGIETESYDGHD
jgi:hypothetical protein